jgi:hypothetical protein
LVQRHFQYVAAFALWMSDKSLESATDQDITGVTNTVWLVLFLISLNAYEFAVGIYYPSATRLRSDTVSDSVREEATGVLRVPQHLVLILVLLVRVLTASTSDKLKNYRSGTHMVFLAGAVLCALGTLATKNLGDSLINNRRAGNVSGDLHDL